LILTTFNQKIQIQLSGKSLNFENLPAPTKYGNLHTYLYKSLYHLHFSFLKFIVLLITNSANISIFQMNSFMRKRSSKPSPTNLTKPLLKCRVIKNLLKCRVIIVNCRKFYVVSTFWYSHSFIQTFYSKHQFQLNKLSPRLVTFKITIQKHTVPTL